MSSGSSPIGRWSPWISARSVCRVGNSAHGTTLLMMENTTVKVLGDVFRQQLPAEESRLPKEMRRLIVQLERRQRELDQQRDQPPMREPN